MLPDMGVKVSFRGDGQEGSEGRTAIVLPRRAIRTDGNTEVVFVVAAGGVERRAVKLGDTSEDEVFVLSGLSPGELVVLEGPADLKDGDQVKEQSL